MALFSAAALVWYLLLFAALYAGFGVQSPYLPAFLQAHGLSPEAIGIVLAAGTATRLVAGPIAGLPRSAICRQPASGRCSPSV
jgi:PPP family 3-phenylpropionic acid transporter